MSTTSRDKDRSYALGRRALLQFGLATGAALGLPRWKVFEALGVAGGTALADGGAATVANRSVHVLAGRGAFAWFHLLWPHNDVAAAQNDEFAWHAIGQHTMATGTHRPLTMGPETPWRSLPGNRQVTALMAGRNAGNHATPANMNTMLNMDVSCFGAAALAQAESPATIPVIAIGAPGNVPWAEAPGAPRIARVASADDVVTLFNSTASQTGQLLANRDNAELYAAAYRTFATLNSASGRPAFRGSFESAMSAAGLLGRNLANELRPRPEDFMRYGIPATGRDEVVEFGKCLIVTAKAFRMGLTNMVLFETLRDDPHQAFANMGTLRTRVAALGRCLDAFAEDLDAVDDPNNAGTSIWDNTVMSFHGELPKDPLDRTGWPDSSPADCNWTYILGAGHLRSGWFGGVSRTGTVSTFDPATGADVPGQPTETMANTAAAAIAYAIARGDLRRVTEYYRGPDFPAIRVEG